MLGPSAGCSARVGPHLGATQPGGEWGGAGRGEWDGDKVHVGLSHLVGAGPVQTLGPRTHRCGLQWEARGQRRDTQGEAPEGQRQRPRHGGGWPVVGVDGGTRSGKHRPGVGLAGKAGREGNGPRETPAHAGEARVTGPEGQNGTPRRGVSDTHTSLTPRDKTPSILYQSPLHCHRPHSG